MQALLVLLVGRPWVESVVVAVLNGALVWWCKYFPFSVLINLIKVSLTAQDQVHEAPTPLAHYPVLH